jgi:hypothetical protein
VPNPIPPRSARRFQYKPASFQQYRRLSLHSVIDFRNNPHFELAEPSNKRFDYFIGPVGVSIATSTRDSEVGLRLVEHHFHEQQLRKGGAH